MKLARSRKIKHKIGGTFTTPILVPSFSSKGLGFIPQHVKFGFAESSPTAKISEINEVMATVSEVITDTALISAFDIAQGFIPKPENLTINVELLFADSGGYETSNYYDDSELFRGPVYKVPWSIEEYHSVLHAWPKHIPSVFVSFDQNVPIGQQIEDGQKLAATFPNQLSDFLIKPEKASNLLIPTHSIAANIDELKHFDIIGVTEKELGYSILDRMVNLGKLRIALDEAGIKAPIHIFGSLDPITSCLYFLAGAEIFDGLTWFRLAYWNGIASYKQNFGACAVGIHESDDKIKAKNLFDNLYYLQMLRSKMEEFATQDDIDFKVFPHHAKFLEDSHKTLKSKLKQYG